MRTIVDVELSFWTYTVADAFVFLKVVLYVVDDVVAGESKYPNDIEPILRSNKVPVNKPLDKAKDVAPRYSFNSISLFTFPAVL